MNVGRKERLLKLLDRYCDDNYSVVIGHGRFCNADCRFNCPIDYCLDSNGTGCPLLDIRNQIRRECDE